MLPFPGIKVCIFLGFLLFLLCSLNSFVLSLHLKPFKTSGIYTNIYPLLTKPSWLHMLNVYRQLLLSWRSTFCGWMYFYLSCRLYLNKFMSYGLEHSKWDIHFQTSPSMEIKILISQTKSCQMLKQSMLLISISLLATGERILKIAGLLL